MGKEERSAQGVIGQRNRAKGLVLDKPVDWGIQQPPPLCVNWMQDLLSFSGRTGHGTALCCQDAISFDPSVVPAEYMPWGTFSSSVTCVIG